MQPVNMGSSSSSRRHRKRFTNMPLEKLMEKFLEQSLEAEETFYRIEEQRLQAEDLRREAEHTRELHMLQMLGQMFAGLTTPQQPRNLSTSPAVPSGPATRVFCGNLNHQASKADYVKHGQPAAPGWLRTTDDLHYSLHDIFITRILLSFTD